MKIIAAFVGPDTSTYQGCAISVTDRGEWLTWNWTRKAWEQFIPPPSLAVAKFDVPHLCRDRLIRLKIDSVEELTKFSLEDLAARDGWGHGRTAALRAWCEANHVQMLVGFDRTRSDELDRRYKSWYLGS